MNRSVLLILLLATGCVTRFSEDHFFGTEQRVAPGADVTTNFLRMRASGYALFSSARYLSGYYDERAVDLFFNELKLAADGQPEERTLFPIGMKEPGTETELRPLSPDAQHGSFVMVFSTNASAVADSIGQLAENQIVADAVTNLANQDTVRRLQDADPEPRFEREQAKAFAGQLDGLMSLVPAYDPAPAVPPTPEQTQRAYLRVMNAIAAAEGHREAFDTLPKALEWFAAREQE